MARGYPRFLHSKVENAKSNGHFVVSTVFPKGVFKVEKVYNNFIPTLIESWENGDLDEMEIHSVRYRISSWLKSQEHIVW